MLAAMALQQPDRVPVMCQMSIGHMLQQLDLSPVDFWFDCETFARGLLELRRLYRFDGILVSLHGHSPDWRDQVLTVDRKDDQYLARLKDRTYVFSRVDLPQVVYDSEPAPPSIAEVQLASIPGLIDYIPVSQGLHFAIDPQQPFTIFRQLQDATEGRYSIHGEVTSPFDYFLDLLGIENALMALIEHPDESHAILQRFTAAITALTTAMCREAIDAIKISSPFAGMGFISPQFYSEFVAPYERQVIVAVRSADKFVYIHTCGAIDDRLELMEQAGASGLECLDPPPLGNVQLADAIRRIGKTMFIKGNIDSVNTLLYGTNEDVEREVTKIILQGKGASGFILSTACSIAPQVPRGQVQRLVSLAESHGGY